MILKTLSTLFIMSILVIPIHATNYFVSDAEGDDNNEGLSIDTPFKSISKANGLVQAGDTVFIAGGTYTGQSIAPKANGNEDDPIVYCKYDDEKVRIDYSDIGINLSANSYIIVHGIDVFYCKKYMTMANSHYNEIAYCVFDSAYNNTSFTGIQMGGPNASYNWIHHCSISRYGGTTNENGDMLSLEGRVPDPGYVHHNLIEDNHIFQGRHNLIATSGQFNIIRNNYFHSENWDEGGQYGGRLAEIKGTRETSNWNLLEGNRFGFSGNGDARAITPGIKLVSPDNIFRFNLVNACKGPGIQVVEHNSDGPYGSDNNYIFHNVIYYNGLDPDGPYGIWFRGGAVNTAVVKNNIFYDNPTHIGDRGDNVIVSNWEEGNPEFMDVSIEQLDPDKSDYPDFNLKQSSGCIDAGAFLTITVGDGSGNVIPVEDAHYFIDGWGIVEGDLIQLEGSPETLQIMGIDYEENMITVDKSVSWSDGLGVSFSYSSTAPDIGTFEYPGPRVILSSDIREIQNELAIVPNPFNDSVEIRFRLDQEAKVSGEIYDMQGRRVVIIQQGKTFRPGVHTIVWDKEKYNNLNADGIYFYHHQVGDKLTVKKMLKISGSIEK